LALGPLEYVFQPQLPLTITDLHQALPKHHHITSHHNINHHQASCSVTTTSIMSHHRHRLDLQQASPVITSSASIIHALNTIYASAIHFSLEASKYVILHSLLFALTLCLYLIRKENIINNIIIINNNIHPPSTFSILLLERPSSHATAASDNVGDGYIHGTTCWL
jgi:hypothetical protein